jgi:hypothetical protein
MRQRWATFAELSYTNGPFQPRLQIAKEGISGVAFFPGFMFASVEFHVFDLRMKRRILQVSSFVLCIG